jgi:hypothetical protein
METSEKVVLFILVLVLLFLLWLEWYSQDCENNKPCSHYAVMPEEDEDINSYIDKLVVAVRNNYNFVAWRQAIILALILTPVIIYLLFCRLPTIWEWIVLVLIIFIGVSLSSSWLWNRFLYPNNKKVEEALLNIKRRERKG